MVELRLKNYYFSRRGSSRNTRSSVNPKPRPGVDGDVTGSGNPKPGSEENNPSDKPNPKKPKKPTDKSSTDPGFSPNHGVIPKPWNRAKS